MRLAAVMVDLGWPWWVSLIIAFSVAAACAVAILRTRSGVAHGVLGLLVLQGAALGALSPFVMSGSSSAGTSGMDPAGQAMAGGSRSTSSVIHVIEHAPPPNMRMVGGVLTFANPIFDSRNANRIGRDQGICVHIALAKASECIWTTILPGGQITAEGPEPDSEHPLLFAITGGTGKYKDVRGWVEEKVHNKAGTQFDVIFHVSG